MSYGDPHTDESSKVVGVRLNADELARLDAAVASELPEHRWPGRRYTRGATARRLILEALDAREAKK